MPVYEEEKKLCRKIIAKEMPEEQILSIEPMKEGMTNDSFRVQLSSMMVVIRLNGKGSERLVNRVHEANTYAALQGTGFSDEVLAIDPLKGYKITRFLQRYHVCRKFNQTDVSSAMLKLRQMHEEKLCVPHEFNLWTTLDEYYRLVADSEAFSAKKSSSKFVEVQQILQQVMSFRKILDQLPQSYGLTHIDAVPDNFLLRGSDVRLIDWEYAGMCDQHVDLAMFAVYAGYSESQLEFMLRCYFGEEVKPLIRLKIHIYLAYAGLLWGLWCVYKGVQGIKMGAYAKQQWDFARKYTLLVPKELADRRWL